MPEPDRLLKPLFWMGSSRKDLTSFPADVQDEMAMLSAMPSSAGGGSTRKC